MKRYLFMAEWYPVWELKTRKPLATSCYQSVDVPKELIEEWSEMNKRFDELQNRMASYWRAK